MDVKKWPGVKSLELHRLKKSPGTEILLNTIKEREERGRLSKDHVTWVSGRKSAIFGPL